jgi:uncharacterized protein YodC (DUF2158 family)
MENPFKIGDIVRLKSGSPEMTVNEISLDGALCIWFDKETFCKAWIHMNALHYAA